MVDALSSGGSIRKVVLVRIQSRAQKAPTKLSGLSFIYCLINFENFKTTRVRHKGLNLFFSKIAIVFFKPAGYLFTIVFPGLKTIVRYSN